MFDYKDIQKDFDKVLCHSQNQASVNTDNLFKKWAESKARFIDKMNGQIICESPNEISITLPKEAREQRINNYIEVVWRISGEIGEFLETEKEGLLDNKTCIETTIRNHTIPVGMKIGKVLHKFFNVYCTEEQLEWIIQELSRLIQENTVSGRLCLSVHPLDYLSLSENQHKWRSCHALDGEYRGGNLSYMCDEVTVITYIKSNENVVLPHFPDSVPWNNKKWRCLMFFDKRRHIIWAGRQYPFTSDSALDTVDSKLLNIFNYFEKDYPYYRTGWQYQTFKNVVPMFKQDSTQSYELTEPYLLWNSRIYPVSNFVKDNKYSYAYNDLLNSHFYTPVYLQYGYTNFSNTEIPPIEIGGEAPCIHCGKSHFFDSQTMLCADDVLTCSDEDIDGVCICPRCGERFLEDDGRMYQGELFCNECYEEMDIHTCPQCGEDFCADEGYYDEKSGNLYCCRYCYKHMR